ncbi:ABC transporter permease [Alkaliphilus transvaalensis]|uniref:ABC transporter permease n=1 Tax=Alkaliphilus transvaalensis TaxID=114628 RepID=UPI00047DDB05|nr:ABC-2 family transporter protein [Alkaliphilus transvaalensis]
MKLYLRYVSVLLKSQMQYRTSFILVTVGQFFIPFFMFISVLLLFQRFSTIAGWTLYEVALCYAVINISSSLSECFARGFDTFSMLIVRGEFDRILVRPRTTLLQIFGTKFEFSRIGRLSQGFIALIFSLMYLDVSWDLYRVLTLLLMILSGTFIFTGLYILGATLCFWTVEGLEVVNILTDGGRNFAQYPLSIYQEWVKKFFTYVIPFASVNYLPLQYLLNKANGNLLAHMLAPILGILFIIPCILIWNFGVKHYKSTGS